VRVVRAWARKSWNSGDHFLGCLSGGAPLVAKWNRTCAWAAGEGGGQRQPHIWSHGWIDWVPRE
jgi:hypothetical protein